MIETMGAGCAWIDYNQDGLADLYLVNSAGTDVFQPQEAAAPTPADRSAFLWRTPKLNETRFPYNVLEQTHASQIAA